MTTFNNQNGSQIVLNVIGVIQENKQYLSDIDGLIGDGDHGINMNKGFTMCAEELAEKPGDLAHSLKTLSKILMMKIGGSMGPLYGMLFRSMGTACDGKEDIDAQVFGEMLVSARTSIEQISKAKPGDKTLMDVLVPAAETYQTALAEGNSFVSCLEKMSRAAEEGRDSTKDMLSRIGRSSRLGERSRGVLDAGATSCCLILQSMANTIQELLS